MSGASIRAFWASSLRTVVCVVLFIAAVFISFLPENILRGPLAGLPWLYRAPQINIVEACLYIGAAVLFLYWLQVRLDRRPLGEIGLGAANGQAVRLGLSGFALGVLGIAVLTLTMWALGSIGTPSLLWRSAGSADVEAWWAPLVGGLFKFAAVGFAEEAFFRGYLFASLRRRHGLLVAAIVPSLIFSALHGVTPGFNPVVFVNIVLIAVALVQAVIVTGNLWLPIGFHWAWDWAQYHLIHVVTPNDPFRALLSLTPTAGSSSLLNGGAYFEGSVLLTPILLILIAYLSRRIRLQVRRDAIGRGADYISRLSLPV